MSSTEAPRDAPVAPRPGRRVRAVLPHDTKPSAREVGDRARLAAEVAASLERVRTTAENWRTGMAGLVTLVTAVLLFRGRDSIADYENWVRYLLGVLTSLALVLAVTSLWLFLSAAYGPLRPVSAQSVLDEGGVDIRTVLLATSALADLVRARWLALASAALLAGALLLSWYGPTAPSSPPAFVSLVVRDKGTQSPQTTICGELRAQDGKATLVAVEGEPDPRRIPTALIVSVVLVAKC